MRFLSFLLLGLALLGHVGIWVGIVNRWHGLGFRRAITKGVAPFFYAALIVPLVLMAWRAVSEPDGLHALLAWNASPSSIYWALAAGYGAAMIPLWWLRRYEGRACPLAKLQNSRVVDMSGAPGRSPARGIRATWLARVPGNQLFRLQVATYEVCLPHLPPELEGMSICHWSDFHFSGRIDRGYFRDVARLTSELNTDLVALTGDVCDHAEYIDWVADCLAPTTGRLGKCFILGNHDLRTRDVARLRSELRAAGFDDGAAGWLRYADDRLLVAGNEAPWFAAPTLQELQPTAPDGRRPVRLLLSHSPDRFAWARRHGFDLVLAGHTHGGQVCFPVVGPVLCPSLHGTRYAAGFFAADSTLLHVSRGTSSLFPLRLNCPPELTKLVLRSASWPRPA